MATLSIRLSDDPILKQKTRRVTRLDSRLSRLIDDMSETLRVEHGVGLAAPQIGLSLRLAVIRLPEDEDDPRAGKLIVLVNPEIVKRSGECVLDEGCLSVPGFAGRVKRSERVTVKASDRNGKPIRIAGTGLLAQALQHEIDHLDGILFFERLAEGEKLRQIEKDEETETEEQGG